VEKFDHGGEADCARTIFSGVGVGEEEKRGAETFAATSEQIAGDFADRLVGRGTLAGKFLFDEHQIVANQIENFFNRQKRDGTSPWSFQLRVCNSFP
jgi:hypothetical protein